MGWTPLKVILVFTTLSECWGAEEVEYDLQYRLIKYLQSRTNPNMMPFTGKAVNVTLGVSLHQIIDVDEKHQILSTSMWVRMQWVNPFLSWNKSQYEGIEEINLASDEIWIPDLVLYNSVNDEMEIGGYLNKITTKVIIDSSGNNMWLAPTVFKSHCRMDIASFPFDQQNCHFKYGSWTYDGGRINLLAESVEGDLGKYSENGEWQVVRMPAKRNSIKYVCCPNPYIDITYNLVIRRKPLFYAYNLILPCVVITLLTLLSFLLPPESGERISLAITIMLAMTVFMLLVAESVPANSDSLPIIAVYYYAAMIQEALVLLAICFTLNWYYHNPKLGSMPVWIRKYVLGWLATVLRINKKRYRCYSLDEDQKYVSFHGGIQKFSIFDKFKDTEQSIILHNVSKKNETLCNDSKPDMKSSTCPGSFDYESTSSSSFDSSLNTGDRSSFDESGIETSSQDQPRRRSGAHLWKNVVPRVLRREGNRGSIKEKTNDNCFPPHCFADVRTIAQTVRNHDRLESDMDEWRLAAAIMDKILFWVFVVTIVTTILAVFLQAAFLYDE